MGWSFWLNAEWDWATLFAGWLKDQMGGLTPKRIATEWTLPQLAVLLLDTSLAGEPDPFKPDPGKGERVLRRLGGE